MNNQFKNNTNIQKSKVIIIADNQGLQLRKNLQNLLGSSYHVTSFVKPNALGNVVEALKSDILSLSMSDYVILLGGVHDRNPHDFKFKFNLWLSTVSNTNVIVCEIPSNKYLNVRKLNYHLQFICSKYNNSIYLDLNYSRNIPRYRYFSINLARTLLKEILRLYYKRKMENYQNLLNQNNQICKTFVSVGTQTLMTCNDKNTDVINDNEQKVDIQPSNINDAPITDLSDSEIKNNNNNLFRV